MTEQTMNQTDFLRKRLDDLPQYVARGAQLITDIFDFSVITEIRNLSEEAQLQLWYGAFIALAANIKGATSSETFKFILEEYERVEKK
jgi:hypothetical protein